MPFGLATADEAYAYLEPKYAKMEGERMATIERVFKYTLPFCRCCCGLRRTKNAVQVAAPAYVLVKGVRVARY